MSFDVVIIGGGPAGLSAALNLGRARKRVLLCDAGPRRNAAAEHIHGFVTQDGTTPADFRRMGRQQLEPYTSVEARDAQVEEIRGDRGAFRVRLSTGTVEARRILLLHGNDRRVAGHRGISRAVGSIDLSVPVLPRLGSAESQVRVVSVYRPCGSIAIVFPETHAHAGQPAA